MSDLFFSSNPAEQTRLEGVYVDEQDPPGLIEGVSINRVLLIGRCVRGPERIIDIDGSGRFVDVFGGRDIIEDGVLHGEVWKALANKSFSGISVRRVAPAAATAATVTLDDTAGAGGTNIITVTASSKGTWGNGVTVDIEAASSGISTQFNLRANWRGKSKLYENFDVNGSNNNIDAVLGTDEADYIVVTKLAGGRPHNQSATALSGGTDGTMAATDYQTPLAEAAAYPGVSVVTIAESAEDTVGTSAQATVNGYIVTQAGVVAAGTNDRIFLTWSGKPANTYSQDITALNAEITTRSDRILYLRNAFKIFDPVTGALIESGPHIAAACILAKIDVDIHLGDVDNEVYLSAIRSVRDASITQAALDALRAAGISTLEKRTSGSFGFHSAVTTSLTPGKKELARRRATDYLQISVSQRLVNFVRKRNTVANRTAMLIEINSFCEELKGSQRIIESYDVDNSMNTPTGRAAGLERIVWSVRLIGHMNFIVLTTNIGTGVTIAEG